MVDFIEEVEENLRSDRYASLARRWLPWFAVVLAVVVAGWLGVWAWRTMQDRDVARASEAYDKGLNALAAGDVSGAFTAFEPIGKSGPRGYRTLALMAEGDIRLSAGDVAGAARYYDQAAGAAPNAIFADMARLKAALALLDTAPFPQLQTRLTALIGDKKPFDLQAREALALARLRIGQTTQARGDLNAISLSLGVSPAMRARAQAAIGLIDAGQADIVGKIVAAGALLPPPALGTLNPLAGPSAAQDQPSGQGGEADGPGGGASGSTAPGNPQ